MDLTQINNLSPEQQDAILNGPALAPPPTVPGPRFDDPPNGNTVAYAAVSICLTASSVAVLVRFFAKCIRPWKIQVEEPFMIAAFGIFVGYIYITYWLLDIIGFFVHQWDIHLRDFWTLLYIIHVGSNFYSFTMLIMKTLILREWRRIFVPKGTKNTFWWTCNIVIVVNILFYATVIFLENLSCFPLRRIWDKTVPGSQCLNFKITVLVGASINVILDLITLVLPQRVIWNLKLSTKKKIGVSLVFAIGLLACASATARLVFTVFYFKSDDTAYTLSALSLWLIAEMTCMFLIFAGPAAPHAFAKGEWLDRFKKAFRSWSLKDSKQRTDGTDYSWNYPQNDSTNSRNVYYKIDDPQSQSSKMSSRASHAHSRQNPNTGIMRTTHFTAQEEYIEGGVEMDRLHPWNSEA
ncbi:hypothetical protein F4678DRAFT_432439 [Xylaria arbuscula]|nr:hypothetical protein F4678DRAFT_432439 [Xylaria arbuscula]